jgi:hypothetical protein
MQAHTESRDNKLREQESRHAAALSFAQVSTNILVTTIEMNGTVNVMRDRPSNDPAERAVRLANAATRGSGASHGRSDCCAAVGP